MGDTEACDAMSLAFITVLGLPWEPTQCFMPIQKKSSHWCELIKSQVIKVHCKAKNPGKNIHIYTYALIEKQIYAISTRASWAPRYEG